MKNKIKPTQEQIVAIEKLTGLPEVMKNSHGCISFSNQHLATGAGTWPRRMKNHQYINIGDNGGIDTFNLSIDTIGELSSILKSNDILELESENNERKN